MKYSKKLKSELFNALMNEFDFVGTKKGDEDDLLDFISKIWNLREMPSEDERLTNAYDDIVKHTIQNDDYGLEDLLVERLKLLEDDSIFTKFLETIVSPDVRGSEDEIVRYVLTINSFLRKENVLFYLVEYGENELPIYKIKEISDDIPIDIAENYIPFFVAQKLSGWSEKKSSHRPPTIFPSFILAPDSFDDYGYETGFSLFYYESNKICHHIGYTKLTNGVTNYTKDIIPEYFQKLGDDFCSLSEYPQYYQNLKDIFGIKFESILYALKDAGFFNEISDKFQRNKIFQISLLRSDSAERNLREIKHRVYGFDLNNLYKFKYNFTPKYSEESSELQIEFNNTYPGTNRIYAIIGRNGAGKTQLITSLPRDISKKNEEIFSPRVPLFSKVIAVSYSVFDNFEIPPKSSLFNYVYCGVLSDKNELLTIKQRSLRFHNSWKKIRELGRMKKWRKILSNFIDSDILSEFIVVKNEIESVELQYTVDIKAYNKIKNQLSSGQSIMLYIITEIVANIRFDSLILYDEPETHLHPNAISQLMNTIFELIEEFQSYCIFTTHSPLIIQQLFAKNVYIMERHENIPSLRKIGIESFGENLTTLTEEVFGNKEIDKNYKRIIDTLSSSKSYSEVITTLESESRPLSLNTQLYIRSKFSE